MARAVPPPEQTFPVTGAAPHVRGFWSAERINLAVIAALLPPLGVAIHGAGPALLPGLGVALLVAVGWQVLFSRWSRRPLTLRGVVIAVTFVMMLPPAAPLWQIALALSFGVVVGEQIFGGYGWNFLNPATVGLAFLIFSFPDGSYDKGALTGWMACLPGALLLVVTGVVSWRLIASALLTELLLLTLTGSAVPFDHLLADSFAFGLIFLACDPVAAPDTNAGRWIYGIVIGGLVALGGTANGPVAVVVFACLIGSIFAPLIDQGVIGHHARKRLRRHGKT